MHARPVEDFSASHTRKSFQLTIALYYLPKVLSMTTKHKCNSTPSFSARSKMLQNLVCHTGHSNIESPTLRRMLKGCSARLIINTCSPVVLLSVSVPPSVLVYAHMTLQSPWSARLLTWHPWWPHHGPMMPAIACGARWWHDPWQGDCSRFLKASFQRLTISTSRQK